MSEAQFQENSRLVKDIETHIPTKVYKRYALFVKKLNEGELTEDDHKEALTLFDELEGNYLRRLKTIEKLASIRKVDLAVLAKDLGFLNPTTF